MQDSRRIVDSSALSTGLVWALLTYPDGSEFCFQTTLNGPILAQHNIVLEEGKLARLDKRYLEGGDMVYKQFSFAGAKVSLWEEETYFDKASKALKDFL